MKIRMLTLFGCIAISLCTQSFGWTESGGCENGNCGSGACDPYESNCQCTDITCKSSAVDSSCTSRAECCEAFGNIGAR